MKNKVYNISIGENCVFCDSMGTCSFVVDLDTLRIEAKNAQKAGELALIAAKEKYKLDNLTIKNIKPAIYYKVSV